VMRWPMVLTTRQLPALVPQPMARWHAIMAQKETEYVASNPPETSAAVTISGYATVSSTSCGPRFCWAGPGLDPPSDNVKS
jgi:hypothetical protein